MSGGINLKTYKSRSEDETQAIGKAFAAQLRCGDVVALDGELGCGKTAFVMGVAEFFGCADEVTSPTFTLVNQYDGDITLYHFDVYRLENPSIEECDWMDDYLFGDGICLIEWADNISAVLPENTIRIRLSKTAEDEKTRVIIIENSES